jgi:hypothetical protein
MTIFGSGVRRKKPNRKKPLEIEERIYSGGRSGGYCVDDLRGIVIVVVRARASDFGDRGKSRSLARQNAAGSG